jgi:hypothetical protein
MSDPPEVFPIVPKMFRTIRVFYAETAFAAALAGTLVAYHSSIGMPFSIMA